MAATDDDWRLGGQEDYLQGAALTWQRYRAWSATWEHDHCEFCWAKFIRTRSSQRHTAGSWRRIQTS